MLIIKVMSTSKKILFLIVGIAVIWASIYVYHVHVNYRFTEITAAKVYRSGAMPSATLSKYIEKYGIKTVVDLRIGNVSDPLNPGLASAIGEEKITVENIEGVKHVNIPSQQIPSEDNLRQFFELLDKSTTYPVLIHCHHGTGRAVLYSALYRVKYEGFSNEEARQNTVFPLFLSSFDDGTPKGEWLKAFSLQEEDEYASSSDNTFSVAKSN